jgi:hypothetical protein
VPGPTSHNVYECDSFTVVDRKKDYESDDDDAWWEGKVIARNGSRKMSRGGVTSEWSPKQTHEVNDDNHHSGPFNTPYHLLQTLVICKLSGLMTPRFYVAINFDAAERGNLAKGSFTYLSASYHLRKLDYTFRRVRFPIQRKGVWQKRYINSFLMSTSIIS